MSEYSLSDLLFEYDKALLGFIADLAENALLQGQAGEIIDESNRRFRAVFDQSCGFLGLLSIDGKRLFQEIGRRLSDALTSLLILRDLKESEDKYRTLVQKIHAAVIVHGADTRILTCNPTAEKLLGLTEAQLLGKTAFATGSARS
jgi:PAS domain-containing protein